MRYLFLSIIALLFIPQFSFASVPTDYGNTGIQRTAYETSGNYANWCTTASSTANGFPLSVSVVSDANGYYGYHYVMDDGTTTKNLGNLYMAFDHDDDCETHPANFQDPPDTSWIDANLSTTTSFWWFITDTRINYSGGDEHSYIDHTGTSNRNSSFGVSTMDNFTINGESYYLSKLTGIDYSDATYNTLLPQQFDFAGTFDEVTVYATIYTSADLSVMVTLNDMQTYLENLFYASQNNLASSTASSTVDYSGQCPTCTRVVSTDPAPLEVLPSILASLDYNVEFYTSEEDYCSNLICQSYITVSIANVLSNIREYRSADISSSGYQSFTPNFTNTTATGTYSVSIEIQRDYPLGIDTTQLLDYRSFSIGAATPTSTIREWQAINNPQGSPDTWVEEFNSGYGSSPLADKMKEYATTFLMLPPWGYVSQMYVTLYNPATSSLPSIHVAFPVGLPGAGHTLTLSPQEGLSTALANIEAIDVSTIDGSPMDQFLYYWEILWYIIFGFWLVREVTKSFSFSIDSTSHIREVNMRKPRSGNINVTKG